MGHPDCAGIGYMDWGFYAYRGAGAGGRCELCGLCGGGAGVCYRDEAGCGAGDRVGGSAAGAGADEETDCGDWWNYAGECTECDRCGGGFGGGYQCSTC